MSRKRWISIAILSVVIGVSSFGQSNSLGDVRIVSKKRHTLGSIFNPHVSPVNILIINGHRFEHVRGVKAFYLSIPKLEALLFITDQPDKSVNYHIFKPRTETDIAIAARWSVFGRSIGSATARDTVKSVTDDLVVLETSSGSGVPTKTFVGLDVVKKRVAFEKTAFYDQSGKLIREHVISGPK